MLRVLGPCFGMQYLASFLAEEERAISFTLMVCLMSCDCWCSVALPQGAVVSLQCASVDFPGHT